MVSMRDLRAGSLCRSREQRGFMSEFWQRFVIAGVVIVLTLVLARIVDRLIGRRLEARPAEWTRYRVVRRSAVAAILVVGILSALLVVPGIRAVAGTVLASSAVIALIVGFAAQTTLSNFVAGLFLAFTQPLRLGDRVEIGSASGVVEEIGLTYTLIRGDGALFFVPNTKLASDTIRNETSTGTSAAPPGDASSG
jgi:small conductance mechanosensitive channel